MLRGGLRSFVVARQLGQPDVRRAVQRNILIVVEACVGVCCLLCATSRDIRCIVEDVRETIAVKPQQPKSISDLCANALAAISGEMP
jgi:hypothetical protein